MTGDKFEPKIIAFICRWGASAAADLAGVSRVHYPPNAIPITVKCSGMIDTRDVLAAFKNGADGVLIGACQKGGCHYMRGNENAAKRMNLLKDAISQLGIDPRRLKFEHIAGFQGARLGVVMEKYVDELKEIGPLELSSEVEKKFEKTAKEVKEKYQESLSKVAEANIDEI